MIGGSAGIGRASALQFDANGCTVAVLGRRLERLQAVVSLVKSCRHYSVFKNLHAVINKRDKRNSQTYQQSMEM